MGLLGPNMKELFNFCEHKFTLKTLVPFFAQLLERLKQLHDTGYIHRDLKPDNICIGIGKKENLFYLIDFGLSKRYRCPHTGKYNSDEK